MANRPGCCGQFSKLGSYHRLPYNITPHHPLPYHITPSYTTLLLEPGVWWDSTTLDFRLSSYGSKVPLDPNQKFPYILWTNVWDRILVILILYVEQKELITTLEIYFQWPGCMHYDFHFQHREFQYINALKFSLLKVKIIDMFLIWLTLPWTNFFVSHFFATLML